mgnify:CR=1 FL=1
MSYLKEGDRAPLFTGVDQNDDTVSLKDFKGRKVVLYFYPKDMTPTCTVQACNLRDNYALLQEKGYAVIGVSPDPVKKHKKFETAYQLPFTLLADPDRVIISRYEVWGEKKLYGRTYQGLLRTTFVIDEKGRITKIITKPKSKSHAAEILAPNSTHNS